MVSKTVYHWVLQPSSPEGSRPQFQFLLDINPQMCSDTNLLWICPLSASHLNHQQFTEHPEHFESFHSRAALLPHHWATAWVVGSAQNSLLCGTFPGTFTPGRVECFLFRALSTLPRFPGHFHLPHWHLNLKSLSFCPGTQYNDFPLASTRCSRNTFKQKFELAVVQLHQWKTRW